MTQALNVVQTKPLAERVSVVDRVDLGENTWISVWAMSSADGQRRHVSISFHADGPAARFVSDLDLPLGAASKLGDLLHVAVESAEVMGEMSAAQWERFKEFRAAAEAQGGAA